MKKKFVSFILCLVFIFSITVSAETKAYAYDDVYPYVEDINEYLTQLNTGLVIPSNSTITTTNSVNQKVDSTISPYWAWTDCSNVLGHSWNSWGAWEETNRVHVGNPCMATLTRYRYCTRTYCGSLDSETTKAWVTCYH